LNIESGNFVLNNLLQQVVSSGISAHPAAIEQIASGEIMNSFSEPDPLQRRNYELSILNEIASALNREVDLDKALKTALAHVVDLCHLQTGWIWLIDEVHGDPYLAVTQHLPPALADNPHRMSGTTWCHCLDTYQKGDMEGAANINIITCTRLKYLVDGTDGLRSHASVPLYAHGKKLGVLNVASRDWRDLSADDLRLLNTVGDLMSMAIERGRLFANSAEVGAAQERGRLAREIHDTLAQGLTAIALQLETADALLDVDRGRARATLQQALATVRSNLDEARRSMEDLRAAPLEGQRLPVALDRLAHDYAARWSLKYKTVIHAQDDLPARVENALFRIAQEALSNIVRHAAAEMIVIKLLTKPHEVTLIIADDGQGFDPAHVPSGRYGLIGINERVKLLGGTLKLTSKPQKGTTLEARIPFTKP
jgi:two-component system, NarL family, sensor kinase